MEKRWKVTVIQDEAADYNRQAPVTGVMLCMDSEGWPRYQPYEYRSDQFTVDPQYLSPQKTDLSAAQHSVPSTTGSFFESSFTKNWFSAPRDLDAYCSQSSSSTTVSRLFDSISKREPEPEVMFVYQRAVSSIEKYQRALSKYVENLESGRVDTLILDSERADLLLLYQDAYTTVNEYQRLYNVESKPQTHAHRDNGSSSAVRKSESNSSTTNAQTPRTRARRIYHM
jgi:hypothetical protein